MEAGALYLRAFSFDVILVCFVFCLNGFFGGCGTDRLHPWSIPWCPPLPYGCP